MSLSESMRNWHYHLVQALNDGDIELAAKMAGLRHARYDAERAERKGRGGPEPIREIVHTLVGGPMVERSLVHRHPRPNAKRATPPTMPVTDE